MKPQHAADLFIETMEHTPKEHVDKARKLLENLRDIAAVQSSQHTPYLQEGRVQAFQRTKCRRLLRYPSMEAKVHLRPLLCYRARTGKALLNSTHGKMTHLVGRSIPADSDATEHARFCLLPERPLLHCGREERTKIIHDIHFTLPYSSRSSSSTE